MKRLPPSFVRYDQPHVWRERSGNYKYHMFVGIFRIGRATARPQLPSFGTGHFLQKALGRQHMPPCHQT